LCGTKVSLTLAPESDYQAAEKRILGAVERVYADYRERIEPQYQEMERTLSVAVAVPKPRSQLHLTQSGLEIVIRYPVELETRLVRLTIGSHVSCCTVWSSHPS
jgi:hypothetical protein